MTFNRSSVFLEVIQNLSKNRSISDGDVVAMTKEILTLGSHFLKINRANAWMTHESNDSMKCVLAYDKKTQIYSIEPELKFSDLPVYFNHIMRNDIILSIDSRNDPFCKELLDTYLIPNNVYSMMEIPLIINSQFKGIICFEETADIREWTFDEQHFALALSQILIQTVENKEKNEYRKQLEILVQEKNFLLSEVNQRVKNNLAVLTSLIRTEANRSRDEYHKDIFDGVLLKTISLTNLVHSMYQTENFLDANFGQYVQQTISNIRETYGKQLDLQLELQIHPVHIEVNKAIPTSLIINEILVNFFKYGFKDSKDNLLSIELTEKENNLCLSIFSNGCTINKKDDSLSHSFEFIEGLVEQIEGNYSLTKEEKGMHFTLECTTK